MKHTATVSNVPCKHKNTSDNISYRKIFAFQMFLIAVSAVFTKKQKI